MERQDLAVPEHPPLHGLPLDQIADVLGEVALEIALGEGRVVPGERREHLVGIAGRLRVRPRDLVGPPVRLGVGRPHTDRADMRLRDGASHIDADVEALFGEVAVLQVAPDLAPRLALAHDGAPADALDLGLEIPGFLRREPLPFHAPRRDQEMRVPVGALALRIARMRRVHVELNRETLRDEVFDGKAPRELDPILRRELGVRRQRQHDLAGKLRVLAPLRRLGRIPQDRRVRELRAGALGQQHLVMLRRVAVLEIVERPRPLGMDRLPGVVGGRPHRAAARRSRNVAGASERDGHRGQARLICPASASRIRQNAYCVCTRAAGPVQNRGFRGAPQGCSATKKTGRNAPLQGCRPREGRLPAEDGRLRWTSLHRNPPQHSMGRAAANSTGLIQGGP